MAGESYTWIDATSTSHVMDGVSTNVAVEAGPIGLYMPPVNLLDQRTPGEPGTTIIYTDILAKPITLPLRIECATEEALNELLADMVDDWFSAPGTLVRTRPDGTTQRQIGCNYAAGLEIDETPNPETRGPGWCKAALQLLAEKPFWQDMSDTTAGPYSNTQMGAGQTVANGGKYKVYPSWSLTGPFTNLVITNTTTGEKIDLTANGGISLITGDGLTIDTNAGTVLKNGSSEIDKLTNDSNLFALAVGNNAITWTYSGGSAGDTTTTVTFRQRYRSP